MLQALSDALSIHRVFWTTPDHTEEGVPYLDVFHRDRVEDDAIGAVIRMEDASRLRVDAATHEAPIRPLGFIDNDDGRLHQFANAGELIAWLEANA